MKLLLAMISMFVVLNVYAYKPGDKVVIATEATCPACQAAKEELTDHHIPFTEAAPTGISQYVPQFYVNGKYLGDGTTVVEEYINQ